MSKIAFSIDSQGNKTINIKNKITLKEFIDFVYETCDFDGYEEDIFITTELDGLYTQLERYTPPTFIGSGSKCEPPFDITCHTGKIGENATTDQSGDICTIDMGGGKVVEHIPGNIHYEEDIFNIEKNMTNPVIEYSSRSSKCKCSCKSNIKSVDDSNYSTGKM